MLPKPWEKLPPDMQNEIIRPYYDALKKKPVTLILKRLGDIIISSLLLIILFPLMFLAFFLVLFASPGPVFYCQKRVGMYGKNIRIYKFRTMVCNADRMGTQVTIGDDDPRITKVGKFLRSTRIDEFPQLVSVLRGQMTLVGTRPEVRRYVDLYTTEMMATLLMPPGSVSDASIAYRHENELLAGVDNPEEYYEETVLPAKMKMNLDYLRNVSIYKDIVILIKTVGCVFKR